MLRVRLCSSTVFSSMIGFGTGARASFLFLPLSSCLFAHVGDLGAEARGEAHREAHHHLGE